MSEDEYLENDDLDNEKLEYSEDEYARRAEGDDFEAPRIPLPSSLVWSLLVLLGLAAVALMVWGVSQSTWTYSTTQVDAGTRARLGRIRDELAAAGAPEAALRRVEQAAQPGVYTDDALEALLEADKALEPLAGDPSITPVRRELRAIVDELGNKRYGYPLGTPLATWTPLPTLVISQ
jgi:hypothetical protein